MTRAAPIMRRLRSERGYSLVELLVTLTTGIIVLMATFLVVDTLVVQSAMVQDRVDNVQRGRQAMENMTQTLRSQVCLGPGYPAITQGDDNSVTYYANVRNATFAPDKYRLVYDPATNGGTITEYFYQGSGTPPAVTFPANPTSQRTIITHASRYVDTSNNQTVPVFRYYAFTSDPVAPDLLQGTPLDPSATSTSANASAKTVKVAISFAANPTRQSNRTRSTFQNYVYVRTADPTDPDHSPQCN